MARLGECGGNDSWLNRVLRKSEAIERCWLLRAVSPRPPQAPPLRSGRGRIRLLFDRYCAQLPIVADSSDYLTVKCFISN